MSNISPENECGGSGAKIRPEDKTAAYRRRGFCVTCGRGDIRVKTSGRLYLHSKKEH